MLHVDTTNPKIELPVGKHKIQIVGQQGCCEPVDQDFTVETGEGEQAVDMKPVYKKVTVGLREPRDGAILTVKDAAGKVLADRKSVV